MAVAEADVVADAVDTVRMIWVHRAASIRSSRVARVVRAGDEDEAEVGSVEVTMVVAVAVAVATMVVGAVATMAVAVATTVADVVTSVVVAAVDVAGVRAALRRKSQVELLGTSAYVEVLG